LISSHINVQEMKLTTTMPKGLRPAYRNELTEAATLFALGQWSESWRHLERAHIIAQPYPIEHTEVHWQMLRFGIRTKNGREVLGQLPRLLVGGVKSFVGQIPVGNTGGANVPPLRPMPIPEALKAIIDEGLAGGAS
jgi:hypothetical protein